MEKIPLYNQNEVMDCGPACLRMISNTHTSLNCRISLLSSSFHLSNRFNPKLKKNVIQERQQFSKM